MMLTLGQNRAVPGGGAVLRSAEHLATALDSIRCTRVTTPSGCAHGDTSPGVRLPAAPEVSPSGEPLHPRHRVSHSCTSSPCRSAWLRSRRLPGAMPKPGVYTQDALQMPHHPETRFMKKYGILDSSAAAVFLFLSANLILGRGLLPDQR